MMKYVSFWMFLFLVLFGLGLLFERVHAGLILVVAVYFGVILEDRIGDLRKQIAALGEKKGKME